MPDLRNSLLDALAELLVRIHLAGFFWGDCSLSNTLFRRDAGTLSAYLVDAETGELHPQLSDGSATHDLQIAEENVAGELLDLEAAHGRPALGPRSDRDGGRGAAPLRGAVVGADARGRLRAGRDVSHRRAPARLNELGFDVEEVELVGDAGGQSLRLNPQVVEPGHHRRRLHTLTGLDVQENQARRLLNDLATFRATGDRAAAPEAVVAYRWLTEFFEPSIARSRSSCAASASPPSCSTRSSSTAGSSPRRRGRDVGMPAAVDSYVEEVLRHRPDEKAVLTARGRRRAA